MPIVLQPAALLMASVFTDPRVIFPVIWLGIALLAVLVESMTADLVSIWFIPAALAAMVLAIFVPKFWIQAVVFACVSALLLVLSRTVFRQALEKRHRTLKTGAYALEGSAALVEEDVDNALETGAVKVNGQLWTARMESDADKAQKGQHVVIVRVEGSKLIVKPRV